MIYNYTHLRNSIKMNRLYIVVFLYLFIPIGTGLFSQPNYDFTKLKKEKLGRGFIAVRENANTVNLSWRYLSSDPIDIAFDIYRDGKKNKSYAGTQCYLFQRYTCP